jgi:hypothetical protein
MAAVLLGKIEEGLDCLGIIGVLLAFEHHFLQRGVSGLLKSSPAVA